MAESIGHKNEARNINYIFSVGFNRELTFSVQGANITGLMFGDTMFYSRYKDVKLPSNKFENEPLTCDFIVSEDLTEWVEIYKWVLLCKNSDTFILENSIPCTLTVLDSHSQPLLKFHYSDVFPIELSGLQYSIATDNSEVLTFSATFSFNRFSIEMPNGDIIDESYTG